MQPTRQDFAETYRQLPDEDIAALNAERDTLTVQASEALAAEIERRAMSDAQLGKMHAWERRREAGFDRREKKRRKMVAEFLLSRWRRRLLGAALAGLMLLWIFERVFGHH
jgi:hypothetical protein